MRVSRHRWLACLLTLLGLALLGLWAPVQACVLCVNLGDPFTIEIERARLVVFGSVASSRLNPNAVDGTSEFLIEAVIKDDGTLKERKTIPINRYVPANPKIKFMIFVDVVDGAYDVYRSLVFSTDRVVNYLKNLPPRGKAETDETMAARLRYLFDFLNDAEPEVAADAYKEFATSSNRSVALAAPSFSADKLRTWLTDPKTDPARLSLYGYLLGACGDPARDVALLKGCVLRPDERMSNAIDGLLAGLIQLNPAEGWRVAQDVVTTSEMSFVRKRGVLTTMTFLYSAHGAAVKPQVLALSGLMLKQADIMDLVMEHLRRWQLWDHTDVILGLYGTPAAAAPMTQRNIVRYALSCGATAHHAKAAAFIAELRRTRPDFVKDVEEGLRLEALPR
ncbi:MAG TPA: hypothetical protein PKD86_06185 [Gemmatales bacterium]|nr:hypothetical protein [Gemmatales bacterium]HMP58924.1 hypothetical protein [Gemmatales bacterium]